MQGPPLEEHPFVPRLRKAIGCPVRWEDHIKTNDQLCKDLRIYWAKVAQDFQTDIEMRYYSRHDVESALDEAELRRLEINAAVWRPRAVDEYHKHAGFLTSIHFATREQYGKHFPPPGMSPTKVLDSTINDVSLFRSSDLQDELESLLFSALAVDLLNVVRNHPPHLFIEAYQTIGACEGQWTRILRLDFDYDKPIAHGHPRCPLPPGEILLPTNADKDQFSDDDYMEFCNDIDEPREMDAYELSNWKSKHGKKA